MDQIGAYIVAIPRRASAYNIGDRTIELSADRYGHRFLLEYKKQWNEQGANQQDHMNMSEK